MNRREIAINKLKSLGDVILDDVSRGGSPG